MAIAIIVGRNKTERESFRQWFSEKLRTGLLNLDPCLDIRIYPELGDLNEIECTLVWRPPLGKLSAFPRLKCILSLTAGVDHIFEDRDLPSQVPIARIVDPYMGNEIAQYVLVTVLNYVKRMDYWAISQKKKEWNRRPPFNYADKTIGMMGMGFLGRKAALLLQAVGLKVIGWSQSPKKLRGIQDYVGKDEFYEFLSRAEILLCLLPLTQETRNILNEKAFSCLPKGSYLINLARGQHIVEKDLIAALNSEQLAGACLDVFEKEPLPDDHPFWSHPKIKITPHIASVTNCVTVVPQIYENICRARAGRPLLNLVDLERGY